MGTLTSPRVIKDIISRHNFRFSKSLGQNFLIDQNIVHNIVDGAGITKGDRVLEIGPGIGTLTRELAVKAAQVVAVEIDKTLLPVLDETVGHLSNVHIINDDILKIDLDDVVKQYFDGNSFKIVGNLPYYITTPIIMRFLEEELPFETMTVMIQKEVSQRISAEPGTKNYGALTVAIQFYTTVRIIAKVPRTVFMPPPNVDSVVVSLSRCSKPPVVVNDKELFFRIIRAAFAQRRKTLLNNLTDADMLGTDKKELAAYLRKLGVDPDRRGETLSIREFAELANVLKRKIEIT